MPTHPLAALALALACSGCGGREPPAPPITASAATPATASAAAEASATAPASSQAPGASPLASNPDRSGDAPSLTPAAPSPLGEPATQKDAGDLAWLTRLVKVLAEKPATRADVIAYLGSDGGAADRGRRVTPRLSSITDIVVYSLDHISIDVALDLGFAGTKPTRAAAQAALGPLRPVPRNPDDFHSGPRLSFYKEGAHGTVRVFLELDRGDANRVAKLHLDVDGVKAQP